MNYAMSLINNELVIGTMITVSGILLLFIPLGFAFHKLGGFRTHGCRLDELEERLDKLEERIENCELKQ